MNRSRDAGALSARLDIEAPHEVSDGAGGVTRSYLAMGAVWAEIIPGTARPEQIAGREDGAAYHLVRLRRGQGVQPGWRFVSGTRVLRILAIDPIDPAIGLVTCHVKEEAR